MVCTNGMHPEQVYSRRYFSILPNHRQYRDTKSAAADERRRRAASCHVRLLAVSSSIRIYSALPIYLQRALSRPIAAQRDRKCGGKRGIKRDKWLCIVTRTTNVQSGSPLLHRRAVKSRECEMRGSHAERAITNGTLRRLHS
jgi:hypothetical protein